MTVKEELHQLVEGLPEQPSREDLEQLRSRIDELARAFATDELPAFLRDAPIDDEEETDEERAAVAEGYAALRDGRIVPHADVLRRFNP